MSNSIHLKRGLDIPISGIASLKASPVAADVIAIKPTDFKGLLPRLLVKEGDTVSVVSDTTDGTILYAEMPVKTVLRVTHSEPGIKGDTATNTLKPATLETGVEVRVPLFINEGDLIQVDTRDGSYLARAKE